MIRSTCAPTEHCIQGPIAIKADQSGIDSVAYCIATDALIPVAPIGPGSSSSAGTIPGDSSSSGSDSGSSYSVSSAGSGGEGSSRPINIPVQRGFGVVAALLGGGALAQLSEGVADSVEGSAGLINASWMQISAMRERELFGAKSYTAIEGAVGACSFCSSVGLLSVPGATDVLEVKTVVDSGVGEGWLVMAGLG